jgi:hypothetical protein
VVVPTLNDAFQFDLTHQLNVSIKGDGTYDYKGVGRTRQRRRNVVRLVDLLVSGSGKNYVTFTVVKLRRRICRTHPRSVRQILERCPAHPT